MGFAEILQQIKATLEADADLTAYALQKWEKKPTVKVTYRNREEIASADLPVIMITRPSVRRSRETFGDIKRVNRVRLYAGFYQPDSSRRQAELIETEELILSALEKDTDLLAMIDSMTPADSANDEGSLGECCFTVQDIEIEEKPT